MRTGCEFRPKTERILGIVQQKPQNDKRAMGSWEKRVLEPIASRIARCRSLGSETSGLIDAGCLAILPTGCREQQGPHLPVDFDTWFAEFIQ